MIDEEKIIKILQKYQRDLDEYTLKLIATRLNSKRGLGRVDLFDVDYFAMVSNVMSDIDDKKVNVRRHQVKKLEGVFTSAAIAAYMSMKSLYSDGNVPFVPYKKNKEIMDYVNTEVTNRCHEFDNTMRNIGYPITDTRINKKIFKTPSETYQYVADNAKSQELHNPYGYTLWCRKLMRGLLRDGLKIYNYNQDTHRYKHQNSYSYIKNFVKNGIYQISQGIFNVVANQVGINGVELSVHYDCALDHLPVQGHQFTLGEFKKMQSNNYFEDINGVRFHYLDRAIGTWNCRHFVYPIIIGKTQPRYTDEQLQEIKNKSQNYKVMKMPNGEKWFMSYSDYQKYLHNLQDKIDTLKLDLHVAEKLGDKWLIDYYKNKLSEYTINLSSFKSNN